MKKEYERLIKKYFSNANNDKFLVEEHIKILKYILENADFMHIRSVYPELDGSEKIEILLKVPENKRKIKIVSKQKEIKLLYKEH